MLAEGAVALQLCWQWLLYRAKSSHPSTTATRYAGKGNDSWRDSLSSNRLLCVLLPQKSTRATLLIQLETELEAAQEEVQRLRGLLAQVTCVLLSLGCVATSARLALGILSGYHDQMCSWYLQVQPD